MPSQRKRLPRWAKALLIVGVSLVLLLGGGVAAIAVIAPQQTPEAQLSVFLEALVNDDADTARSFVREIPEGSVDLLTQDMLDLAGPVLESFEILGTTRNDARATVSVAVTQGGTRDIIDFEMSRIAKSGLFDQWQVNLANLPSPTLTFVHPDTSVVTVNGVEVPAFDDAIVTMYMFPGTYELSGADESGLLNFGTTLYDAAFEGVDAKPVTSVTARLSETGEVAARAAVDAHIAGCVTQPVLAPANCGLSVNATEYVDTNIRWTVVAAPGYGFGEWVKDGVHTVVTSPGTVRFNSDLLQDGDHWGTSEVVIDDWKVMGSVRFNADGTAVFVSSWG